MEPGKGFWHRPKNGPDFIAFYYSFGGETIDPTTGKLVFDREASNFSENFGFGLIPALEKGGRPNTLTHPMAYLISAQSKHPDLALALLAKLTTDENNTGHSLNSTHLGILKSQAGDLTTDEAMSFAEEGLQRELGDELIIR